MRKIHILLVAFVFFYGAMNAQNQQHYTPDAHAQNTNTPIVTRVLIEGETPATLSSFELGAFVNDSLRGSAFAFADLDNTFWIQVHHNDVYTSSEWQDVAGTITFKIYDHSKGIEYVTCSTVLETSKQGYGTLAEPVILDFARTTAQSTSLVSGWNWYSTYIEQSGTEGMLQLKEALGSAGVQIKSQTASTQHLANGNWFGTLTTLENEKSYRVNLSATTDVVLTGTPVKTAEHPIAIQPNWTWIGYPVSTTQSVSTALSGFTPQNGDVIKSQGSSSTYLANRWFPAMNLEPGQGYLYKSNATTNKTLTFALGKSEVTETEETPRHWANDIHAFGDNMTVIAVVSENGEELYGDNYELGAFVNGENRGCVKLEYFEPLDRYFAVLTINADEGEYVSFGIFDRNMESESFDSNRTVVFAADAVVGTLNSPLVVEFGSGIDAATTIGLYPNPVRRNEAVMLDLPNETIREIVVTNVLGETICSKRGNEKELHGIAEYGIYCIQVYTEEGNIYHGKLIVR